ncbi:GIY-YIG nuclease family protein [Cochleicola gelatinilyticus]|uniref:Endonuclease n=1 Tax=Cochleicola gelatinilyticus TaxID=1763537 RepID=A0A167HIT9_9FLAO|nr:GIY-YIG nuclease family protein [Cochleicola gelatinilyticus]OAB78656.1 endonuclease [Cochleicola gelatinilyticus]
MVFIYLQTITLRKTQKIPFRLVLKFQEAEHSYAVFNIRPESSIPSKLYVQNQLDRLAILSATPFCDSADELIELFQNRTLVFSEKEQFNLLKSQFRTIGYNFNVRPKILWHNVKRETDLDQQIRSISKEFHPTSLEFAKKFLDVMVVSVANKITKIEGHISSKEKTHRFDLSQYNTTPGVYFFRDKDDTIVYVGKAKNIRKRLQSHFSATYQQTNINYSNVHYINVVYTGNDSIAQLVETEHIKKTKPPYNSQQINNSAPFIITQGTTASGISKINITRKAFVDSLPERYFNRKSVVHSLREFCIEYKLCKKHCNLERVKGPCSNVTKDHNECVCSGGEPIKDYNARFQTALDTFRRKKTKKIYKLKGRDASEDAFVFVANDIYEGYGYIDKSENISNYNDILSNMIHQENNYETARIIDQLKKRIKKENILVIQ